LRVLTAIACSAVVLPLAGSPALALADDETVVGQLVRTWPAGDPAVPSEHAADGPVSWVRTEDGETVRIATDDVAGVPVGSTVEAALGADVAEDDSATEVARAADVTVLEAAATGTACTAVALDQVSVDSDMALGAWVNAYGTPRLLESTGSRYLGGGITSTPVVAYGSDEFVFVGRGLDNALWLYDGRAGGSGWRSPGGYVL
jgi:hypothetical protein